MTPRLPARAAALLLACGGLACGGAVTDPALDGFPADPRPIRGAWETTIVQPGGSVATFEGELVAAGGVFLGRFDFLRFGRVWNLRFDGGRWDGERLVFLAEAPVADGFEVVEWTATFFRADADHPERLLLTSDATGRATPIEYRRPARP